MDEMVERVARAIADRVALETPEYGGQEMVRLSPVVAERVARAAIAAMREPTEGMKQAVRDAGIGVDEYTMTGLEGERAWQAMIDAAVGDGV